MELTAKFRKINKRWDYIIPIRKGSEIHSTLGVIKLRNNRYHWHTQKCSFQRNWIGDMQGHCKTLKEAMSAIKQAWTF